MAARCQAPTRPGQGRRRPPPGLPSISSSSRSELSGVGLGTPILRRRLWGDSWGRRGLWGARAAGGACPGGGAESGAVKRGCAEPSRAGAANSPPFSLLPLLPPLFPPSAARETSPGRAPLLSPAPASPRPGPSPPPDFDPEGGSASGRRLGELAAPGLLYTAPLAQRAPRPAPASLSWRMGCLQGLWGWMMG